ncbi:FliH/SctL family protein [Microbacterium sp. Marseille-Q6965]|uniref:FliH/SctL family protein n=1 Tax=Microbacterium sp. Marseille-Q6965 TaxID=2965072 RepID=UPI0021B7F7EF|nr:FliH/SctL family protein [Microbacterium sp. Marseille-Q6965]
MSTDASSFTSAVFPRIDRHGAEREREFEAARIRGYAAGHAAGMRAANEAVAIIREELAHERQQERIAAERRIGQALVALDAAVTALAERERELVEAGCRTLERLAVELAEAVVGRELSMADDAAALALHRALSEVGAADVRALRLNPIDLETLRGAGAAPEGVALVADPTLARGDAVATLPEGLVDARIATAFERARRALEDGDRSEALT